MKTVNVFAGIKRLGQKKCIYTLSLYYEANILKLPKREVIADKPINVEFVALTALEELIPDLIPICEEGLKLNYYPGCKGVKEALADLSSSLSASVLAKCIANNIELTIIESDALYAINMMQIRDIHQRKRN